MGYEIHPETPPEGADLSGRYDPDDMAQMSSMLRSRAEELGLPYAPAPILANSYLALAAAEYARDKGHFPEFHHEMLEAVFARGQNIGLRKVIADTARRVGLDDVEILQSIDENRYKERLKQSAILAQQLQITGVPTFIVNDHYKVVGAQPINTLRQVFRKVEASAN